MSTIESITDIDYTVNSTTEFDFVTDDISTVAESTTDIDNIVNSTTEFDFLTDDISTIATGLTSTKDESPGNNPKPRSLFSVSSSNAFLNDRMMVMMMLVMMMLVL